MQQRDARGPERLLLNPGFFKTRDLLVYLTDLYRKLYGFSLLSGPETSCSISATLGILCSLAPPYSATISTCNDQRSLGKLGSTNALLDELNILHAYPDSSGPSKMPSCLQGEILYHDPRQRDQLRIQGSENTVVGKIESVRDLPRDEVEVFMGLERVRGCGKIPRIDRL